MKVEDIIDKMSKSYLEKIVKSFTTGYYQKDEEGYREQIRNNVDHLAKADTIHKSVRDILTTSKRPYQDSLLIQFTLEAFLKVQNFTLSESEAIEKVISKENEIINKSEESENFKHISDRSQSLFEILLETALEDDSISEDEMHLIKAVRKKLGMHQTDHYLIQARLKCFPKKDNEIHSHSEIIHVLNDLQKAGVVFYANKLKQYILPQELVDGVKSYLGIELITEKFRDLLSCLNAVELKEALSNLNLKQSGTKETLLERILITGVQPSEILNNLSTNRLSEICKALPKLKVSGSKEDKITRIIAYFDKLANIETGVGEDVRELYYNYFEYLAKLDMANLLSKKIIKNESDAALAFEKATAYLFETKLNHQPVLLEGTEKPDGCLLYNSQGDLMMWDNKALMNGEKYFFPNNHFRQFKRYIRDSSNNGKRVNCFLIIVPDTEESAEMNAVKLKHESGSDTDIAIVTAGNLKWIAEEWKKEQGDKPINLALFNDTGILDKETLKRRLQIFT